MRILAGSDKKIALISMLTVIFGFAFLFTITSLSVSIIKTKQDNTVNTYGKFLMVIPDLDKKSETEVRKKCKGYTTETFSVLGNIECKKKQITMGAMEESMGKNLAFHVVEGKWPRTSKQIVVEEYLLDLLGIENESLPCVVSLKKEGRAVEYEITGAISNYSSYLSTPTEEYIETKVFPSIICGIKEVQAEKHSFVIMQKHLNFKKAEDDINFLLSEFSFDNMCMNEKLYGRGYRNNRDMITISVVYVLVLNFLLVVEQIIVIRTFLLRNRKTLYLFEALGMSQKTKKKLIFYMIQGFLGVGFLMGYVLSVVIGMLYMGNIFGEYHGHYISALHGTVLLEGIVIWVVLTLLYFFADHIKNESIIWELNRSTLKKQKRYQFQKFSFRMIIMQTICMFFAMFSFYCMNSFQDETGDINYDLYSKQTTTSYPLKGYHVAVYGNDFFPFEALEEFDGYGNYVSLCTEAETKQSTILFKKNNVDPYFNQYFESDDEELSFEDKVLWDQIANEAEKYQMVSALNREIVVLPHNDFEKFLKEKEIHPSVMEGNGERECILVLPNGKRNSHDLSVSGQEILLGGVQGDIRKVNFCTENFLVKSIAFCDPEECSVIQVVMSEESARNSRTVLGYDKISIVVKSDTPISIQNEIEQKISLLMASIQGGMLDSSGQRNHENQLIRNYGTIMGNTILFFCIIAICLYIILSIYNDWEKYHFEYGVLRSMGMSYFTLQNKLFVKYSNSLLVSCIISILLGINVFTKEYLPWRQMPLSMGITIGITYLCRFLLLFRKKQPISSMINKG